MVADRIQWNVYQLKPESGEVRALHLNPCRPISVTIDPTINGLYVICVEYDHDSNLDKYSIRKKTFDGKIDKAIYTVPQSTITLYCVAAYLS